MGSAAALGAGLCVAYLAFWPRAADERARRDIEKLGGIVEFNENSPARPVVGVRLRPDVRGDVQPVTDDDLSHLEWLTQIERLDLEGQPLTDAGLAHLSGLAELRSLNLGRTRITDSGLSHLRGLPKLERLGLWEISITETGLGHLKNMTSLRGLSLTKPHVTEAAHKELQMALPHCRVIRSSTE